MYMKCMMIHDMYEKIHGAESCVVTTRIKHIAQKALRSILKKSRMNKIQIRKCNCNAVYHHRHGDMPEVKINEIKNASQAEEVERP